MAKVNDVNVRTSQRRAAIALAIAPVLFPGCQESLPTTPSELTTGITVYEHANFLGQSAHITRDISDLGDFRGPCMHTIETYEWTTTTIYDWDDCISSVRVAPGWRATLYRDTGYRGSSIEIAADVPNLQLVPGNCPKGGLNDCVSSVRVRSQ